MSTSSFDTYRDPEPEGRRRRRGKRRRRPGQWLKGDGPGERALVPDVEFTSYYGRNIVKPPPWSASIPTYLFLGGLAAGSQVLSAGAHLTGNDALRRPTRLVALLATAGSGAALVEDLGKKSRFLNMMRTAKLTSPMSVGTWILTAFSAGTVPGAMIEASRMLPVTLPKPVNTLVRYGETPVSLVGALFAPPLAAYTAVLLSGTATPTWAAAYKELPFVFVGSACAASGGMAMVWTPTSAAGPARAFALLGATTDLVAVTKLERGLGVVGEPLHHGRAGRLAKASLALNVAGVLGTVIGRRSRAISAASGAAFVLGSVATRFAIFEAGMESARDPKYTVVPQRERLAARGGLNGATTAR